MLYEGIRVARCSRIGTHAPGFAGREGVQDVLVERQPRKNALQQLSRQVSKYRGTMHVDWSCRAAVLLPERQCGKTAPTSRSERVTR